MQNESNNLPPASKVADPALLEEGAGDALVSPSSMPADFPAADEPAWVDVRCCGFNEVNDFKGSRVKVICNQLLLRIMAEPTVDGIKKAVKICLDMKCRRCKEINYRVIVI